MPLRPAGRTRGLIAIVACASLGAASFARQDAVGPGNLPFVTMVPAFQYLQFTRPVGLVHAGDGSNRLFVIEQAGRIMCFDNAGDVKEASVFLDITERVRRNHNEEGLLGMAFHPEHERNGYLYATYSASEPRRNVISRFSVSGDDPNLADADSEKIILEIPQPYDDHNGSTLLFGADGCLYISLGDGGWANDPLENGQNLGTLLGSILRIDVDREDAGKAYAIPDDNPFAGREDARGEIWAYGFRNVWRMSFDRETGELWAGEVGQTRFEEIDRIVRGGNYGWPLRQGGHPFREGESDATLIDPVIEYSHSEGLAVVGGYVYRGDVSSRLYGAYIYADYVTGKIWALRLTDGVVVAHRAIYTPRSRRRFITSFGEDEAGQLYLCAFDRLDGLGKGEGRIYRLHEN